MESLLSFATGITISVATIALICLAVAVVGVAIMIIVNIIKKEVL